jgi:hypothetical protein
MISFALAAALMAAPSFPDADSGQATVRVEHVTAKPKPAGLGLGTSIYSPSEAERPYFEKLDDGEAITGGLAGKYDIHDKQGKYVGWFGIVREIKEDKARGRTLLTVEHKYFDGLTDTHIQAMSFNGDGDFLAVVPGVGHKIEPLSLVKVYGVAAAADKEQELPAVEAQFVRDWHWGAFAFLMASGEQHGSEKWRKLNKVDLDDIYDPYPDDSYYEERLGKRPKER